jgi:hypothetical protein
MFALLHRIQGNATMNVLRPVTLATLLACLPMLGACSSGTSTSNGIAADVSASVTSALDEAQTKLRNEPITVSHNDLKLPKAEITPKGDFIVDGKTIAITPAQRSAVLDYREKLIAVASAGIAVGKQGAAIGVEAAGAALAAVMSGKSDKEVEDSVKAKTKGIREAAAKICGRLPALMTAQQTLAADVPAFKPYATMTQKDIDDCRKDSLRDDDTSRRHPAIRS